MLYEYNNNYLESITIPNDNTIIPKETPFYARVRYHINEIGYSEWSNCNFPYIISPTANIIGVCMVSTGNGTGVFKNIDWQGNFINNFDYTEHPIYLSLSQITIDNCVMMQIPTIYIKTDISGPKGSDSEGKKCWWISDIAIPGFRPAAAFKRDNSLKKLIWWGTYLASSERVRSVTCLSSKYNKTVVSNKTLSTFATYANNRNSNNYTGFRLFDIWDMSLLKLLLLIFGCGSDVQSIWGG